MTVEDKDKRIHELEAQVKELMATVAGLLSRLAKYENPKNSRNSSIPPSKDENRPLQTKSLRKVSGKKVGGQQGHDGHTLQMSETPDEIVTLTPDYCNHCRASLQMKDCQDLEMRQVVDIPPIKAIYTQYQSFSKQYSCGCTTRASFPEGVHSPVSYGSNVESLIAYYQAHQHLPFARMLRIRDYVFPFLLYHEIHPDNNASERAIRNKKVKQKISVLFKTILAAQNFAKIRSVIDTMNKNSQNVLEGLYTIVKIEFLLD